MPSVEGVDDNVPPEGYGVYGRSTRGGYGVRGYSNNSQGVIGLSGSHIGVDGYSDTGTEGIGVRGHSAGGGIGVAGYSAGFGVAGYSNTGLGVYGRSNTWVGVSGESNTDVGVYGGSDSGPGVVGRGTYGYGVYGHSDNYYGVYAFSHSIDHYALYAGSSFGYAAWLDGEVNIRGPLIKPGGQFKIDHPLDPANKYLCHSFVESPDMKNIYDGVVALDDKGEAVIELPDWFGALNKDFRYQLTAIGAPGPNLYIAEEISGATINYSDSGSGSNNTSRFKIAGGTSGMKVSWQVTGIRKDPWANANRIQVEEDKATKERGYYLHPDVYGQPEENGISHLLFPKEKQEQIINENKRSNL
jgi:hypothetical protein